MTRLRLSPIVIFATLLVATISSVAWLFRLQLHLFATDHPAVYLAIAIGTSILSLACAVVLSLEALGLRRRWLSRIAELPAMESVRPQSFLEFITRFPDLLELVSMPLFKSSLGNRLQKEWYEAELGKKASRYIVILVIFAAGGFVIGMRVGGPLLGIALAFIGPLLPRVFVRNRAERHQNRFVEQLPQVLDGLASGLSAGLSFTGAVNYVLAELPEPACSTFLRLSRRLELGIPYQEALLSLQKEVAVEGFSLVIDGLILQRQFGGDMVKMLGETAALLRDRIELDREVRAITTQGRLSGIIIAILVPVSAGLLLAFNPRYIDVLFDNIIGQALVVFALLLQLIGWAIISRLVRVRY